MKRRVELVDTSVFVEILRVPFMDARHEQAVEDLRSKSDRGVTLVLPVATVIETGNHVAQVKDHRARETCLTRYVGHLRLAGSGGAPWELHEPDWDDDFLSDLCDGAFTGMDLLQHALTGDGKGMGAGDLSILLERNRYQARLSRVVEVGVWTYDGRMQQYL